MITQGQRFGRLVAVKPAEERRNKRIVWECKCDCGNTAMVQVSSLVAGGTKSCGCLRKEMASKNKAMDITNQRFGRLVAIKPTEKRHNAYVVWECKCDCGNTAMVQAGSLVAGNTKSCGCLRKSKRSKTEFQP